MTPHGDINTVCPLESTHSPEKLTNSLQSSYGFNCGQDFVRVTIPGETTRCIADIDRDKFVSGRSSVLSELELLISEIEMDGVSDS